MQSELNVFVELADTWETIEGNSDQRAVYRECADGLRMMVDFKRQQIDTGLQPDRAPTHRCTVCGAFWMEWKDSWSLCSKQCGKCCDNVAMCDQIVPLIVSDIYAPAAEITRLTEALRDAEEQKKALREALIRAESDLHLIALDSSIRFRLQQDVKRARDNCSAALGSAKA